jgi:hypothetical protein
VLDVYNYLYGFSVWRLSKLLTDAHLILLFLLYVYTQGLPRILSTPVMRKEREAYFEAIYKIISQSDHGEALVKAMYPVHPRFFVSQRDLEEEEAK